MELFAYAIARVLAVIGLLLLITFASFTVLDGLLRGLFNRPIEVVRDFGDLIAAVAVSSCFPLANLQRSNITIKFIQVFFGRTIAQPLDAIAAVVVMVLGALIAWRLFVFAGQSALAGEVTFMLNFPVAPFWYACAALFAVAAVMQSLVALIAVVRCFARDSGRDAADLTVH